MPTKAAPSLTLLSWTRERKYNERLVGQGKDRRRSLTNLIYYWSNQSSITGK